MARTRSDTPCCGEPTTCKRDCGLAWPLYAQKPMPEDVGSSDTDVFPAAGEVKTPDEQHFTALLRTATYAGGAKVAPAFSDTKPSYYHAGPDDLIAFALTHGIGAIEFTIMRYVMRWKAKQPLLSLRKAREYLDRLIAHVEAEELALKQGGVSSVSDTNA